MCTPVTLPLLWKTPAYQKYSFSAERADDIFYDIQYVQTLKQAIKVDEDHGHYPFGSLVQYSGTVQC